MIPLLFSLIISLHDFSLFSNARGTEAAVPNHYDQFAVSFLGEEVERLCLDELNLQFSHVEAKNKHWAI